MVIFLSGVVAVAAVRVDDPHACLTLESLDLEARDALGDAVVDRYDIYARVESGSDADARQLHLEVSEDGITMWRRDVAVEAVDCPYLASLVVLSVERGLADVPKWVLKHGAQAKLGSELGVLGFVTTPIPEAYRAGATVLGSTGLGPRLRAKAALDLYAIARQDVGRGAVAVYGLALAPGLSFDLLRFRQWHSLRVGGQVGGGPAFLHGQDFGAEADSVKVDRRASATFDVTWATDRNVRLMALVEVPIIQVRLGDFSTGEVVEEPAFRVGAAIGVAFPDREH